MGMIEIEIEFNELRKRNIVRFDENDDWHPYLLVNTDRAYFDLSGNKISVLSRDFSLCRAVRLIAIGTPSKFPKRNSLRNIKKEIGGEK